MSVVAAIATADAIIDAIPPNGLVNGQDYVNTAMPSTSHVADFMKWPLAANGTPAPLAEHLCQYARVDLSTADRAAEANKTDIETAVIVALARLAATKFYAWTGTALNAHEVARRAANAPAAVIHADHADEVRDALLTWASVAPRYMGLVFYNSLSYEICGHHHLPAVTKKLALTTIVLAGLKEWIAVDQAREGFVFHDMFHPVSETIKSNFARMVSARDHLTGLKFDNLRKRIPVKAPDSGVAINYSTLYVKATAYHHNADALPDYLAPPPSLHQAVLEYERAATAADLMAAVAKLRMFSEFLTEPSAYLAGFILGKEAQATRDEDLDLRFASKTTTILGSPAYLRAAGEYSGTFAAGKEAGYKKVDSKTPSQVLPRCKACLEAASHL